MNLTRIIEETGRRIRAGKMPAEKMTNADVKEILETAIEVMKEALLDEGHIEIQNFAVIEARQIPVKSVWLNGQITKKYRVNWAFRPTRRIRDTKLKILSSK
jgi:nucleoid DNA-binding protein